MVTHELENSGYQAYHDFLWRRYRNIIRIFVTQDLRDDRVRMNALYQETLAIQRQCLHPYSELRYHKFRCVICGLPIEDI